MADVSLSVLKSEIVTDPLARGYSGMTDQQIADSLNTANRAQTRTILEAWEVVEATDPTEWAALSAAEKQRYQTLTGAGQVNVNGTNTRSSFAAMFGAGTATRTALQNLKNGAAITRAAELGLPTVLVHHVTAAKVN